MKEAVPVILAILAIGAVIQAAVYIISGILIILACLLVLAIWLAPFWFYVMKNEPNDTILMHRVRESVSVNLVLLIALPFTVLAFNSMIDGTNMINFRLFGVKMGPQEIKALLYAAFIFVFSFGFAAYFLKEIFPWKDTAPVFNNFLAFLSSFFLAAFTAMVVFDGKSTTANVADTASRFSDLASTALSIMFLMMGVFLFWKKAKAYF
jgi:hypothetical protein